MKNKGLRYIIQGGIIAAVYAALTLITPIFSYGVGQVRISEALCVLPFFTSAAVPGLFIGCLLSNFLTGAMLPDIIFGSLATLLGALGSYALRKHKFLVTLPPVVANALIIPFVLRFVYMPDVRYVFHGIDLALPFYALTVGIGEVISVCILGSVLRKALEPFRQFIFPQNLQ